jgi:hypothetical protein
LFKTAKSFCHLSKAILFICFSAITILRMRSSFLARPSYRSAIVFVTQAKQINDNFGLAFLMSSSFQVALAIARSSSRFCLFFQWRSPGASGSM